MLSRALAREKQARKEAEKIAESATRRLHLLNQELDVRVKEATRDLQVREEELRQSHAEMTEALKLRDHFLASMTHELRSPLHSILGLSEALADGAYGEPNDKQARSLRTIYESGEHLLNLINNVLEISKLAAGKEDLVLEEVLVSEVCRDVVCFIGPQAKAASVSLELDLDERTSSLYANTLRVRQVLINLLSNAVKFTPSGGSVVLSSRLDEERGTVELVVADSGIGIAQEDFSKLFQPFVQLDGGLARRAEGSGLGLLLAQRMVDLYGGSISVSSEQGRGTKFTVALPSKAPEKTSGREFEPVGKALIIEDSGIQRLVLARMLHKQKLETIEAVDGIGGLEAVRTHSPDVIFLDLNMPKLDGRDVLKLLRADENLRDIPVCIVSAADTPGSRRHCLDSGASAYFVKPLRSSEVSEFTTKTLNL